MLTDVQAQLLVSRAHLLSIFTVIFYMYTVTKVRWRHISNRFHSNKTYFIWMPFSPSCCYLVDVMLQISTTFAAYLLKYKRSKIRTVFQREMESGIQEYRPIRNQTTSVYSLNALQVRFYTCLRWRDDVWTY